MWLRIFGVVALLVSPAEASGQPSAPPTRTAAPSTPAEEAAIEAGRRLQAERKYDAAAATYREVLKLSPHNMAALYELAVSFRASQDYEKSLAAATRGTEYDSPLLPMFYDLVGSAYDSMGEAHKAVATYRKGIQIVPDSSLLHYKMGTVYLGQENPAKTAAFLAFSTCLIYSPTGAQSHSAIGFWRDILRGGIGTDQGTDELPSMVAQVNGLLEMLAARPPASDRDSFAGIHYLPFFMELARRGYVEPFVFWVNQDVPDAGAREWIDGHKDRVREFSTWARGYTWPKP